MVSNPSRLLSALAPGLVVLLAGCPSPDQNVSDDKTADSGTECAVPTVAIDPGEISITLGQTALIAGSGTGCSGRTVTPEWTLEAVPIDSEIDVSMLNVSDPWAPYIVPDVVGTYVFSLKALDDTGAASVTAYAVVTVTSGNSAPVADCGGNVSATVGDRVEMDGSASADPDDPGLVLEFDWTLSSAPACSGLSGSDVFNGTTEIASVVPDCDGVFVVSLIVSDGENWSAPAYCAVSVAPDDEAPVADAGDSTVLSPCTEDEYQLNGFGSYDPEGEPLTYTWSLLAYPPEVADPSRLTFSDTTVANPYFRWTVPGDYTFMLQVNDGRHDSAPDIVTYTFVDEGENSRPIANAGDAPTISASPDCTSTSYVYSCEDCPSDSVTLDGTASSDPVDGDELRFLWTTASSEVTIAAPFSPTTEVSVPGAASTFGVELVRTWDVALQVSDCSESDSDLVTITYTCTGE